MPKKVPATHHSVASTGLPWSDPRPQHLYSCVLCGMTLFLSLWTLLGLSDMQSKITNYKIIEQMSVNVKNMTS